MDSLQLGGDIERNAFPFTVRPLLSKTGKPPCARKKILDAHNLKTVRSLADGLRPLVDHAPFGHAGAEVGNLKIIGKTGERGA